MDSMMNKSLKKNQIQSTRHRVYKRQHRDRQCDRQSDRLSDITVSSSRYTSKISRLYYFASGNFPDVCVELIWVVQGRLFQGPSSISSLLYGGFRYHTGFDFRCHTSFSTVFDTAWVLAMNKTAHAKATCSNKNLSSCLVLVKVCLSRPLMRLDWSYVFGFLSPRN